MTIAALDAYRQSKPCREYQLAVADKMVAHLDSNQIPIMVMPTGAGKSRTAAEIMGRVAKRRGLVVTHTDVLHEQSKSTIPGCSVLNIQALTKPGAAGDARRAALREFDAAFIDEAHHAVSPLWIGGMQMLRQHGLMVFGATATPQRGDGRALDEFWTDMVVGPKYSELVRWGFLCPCDVQRPKMSRAEQRRKKVRIDGVVSYLEHGRRADGSFRPGIYFDKTIADCIDASRRFNEAGVRSMVVSCEVTGKDRQDIFDAYSRGELDMLCSPVALAEGFDSPRAEVCVLCRSASSIGTYLQMVGRILRPCPGKERALLIDCTGAESIHKAPTADRMYSLSGAGIEDAPEEEEEKELSEEEQKELVLREEWKKVRAEFELVRDQLVNTYTGLRQTATDKQYKNGWVFYQFQNETGLQAPRIIESKYRSVCCHCRRRVEVGTPILWQGPKQVFHQDCWFQTLTDDQLSAYKNRNSGVSTVQL